MKYTLTQFLRQNDLAPLPLRGLAQTAKMLFLIPLICLLFSTESFASHYRYGNITWEAGTGNNITFKVRQAWRSGAFGNPSVGSVVTTESFYFGDGGSTTIQLTVTSVNVPEDWFYGEFTVTRNYAATGNYTAYYGSCCRISTLQNNADGSYNGETIVNVGTGNSSPTILAPIILNMQVGQNPATYQVPANDPNGDNIQYRLANTTEMAGGTNPSGLSISATGLVSFNTVGKTIGDLFSTAFVVEDLDGSNNVKSKSIVDLIIKIVGNSTPPVFNAPTPADGTTLTTICGNLITFDIDASSSGNVILSAVGVPPGATFTNPLPHTGNPATTTFQWTPTGSQIGSVIIIIIAENPDGVQNTRTITVQVTAGPDNDNDGYTECQGDCDETNPNINPGESEILGNNIDDNCDGFVDILPYCTPTITYPCQYMWLTNVTLGSINNTTACGTGAYSDFTALSANLTAGTTYTFSVTGGGSYNQYTMVYVDWNRDGDFADTGEAVVSGLSTSYVQANSTNFAVPAGASGSYTMRVISDYTSNVFPTSCFSEYGEAEDYTIIVGSSCTAPSFTACPSAPVTANTATGQCNAAVTYNVAANGTPAPTLAYAFTGATTGSGSGTGTGATFEKGNTTVTVTATNTCGTPTCVFTVMVSDNEKPTLSGCPSNILLKTNDDGGTDCAVQVTYTAPTFADNCDGTGAATYVSGPTSGTSLAVSGSPYTVVYTKTDAAGNAVLTDCSFTVTVQDDTKPTISGCPSNILLKTNDDGGTDCAVQVTYTAPTFADNCDGTGAATYVSGPTSGTSLAVSGSPYTVVYTKTDAAGNAVLTDCSFTVTVQDDTKPTLSGCPSNILLKTNDDGGADCAVQVTYTAPTFADNCDGTGAATYVSGPTSGTSLTASSTPYTVVYTYIDVAGNAVATNCTFTVRVRDNTRPTLSGCPSNQTIQLDNSCQAVMPNFTGTPTASDNCSMPANIVVSQFPNASSTINGIVPVTVTLTATDEASNQRTCAFTITGITREINVQGNGITISDGDNSPSTTDHTDLGGTIPSIPISRTFTIQNTGGQPLNITSIVSSNNIDFTVGTLMPASPIPAGMSATFTVTFASPTSGSTNAVLTITNDDCNEASYDFAIQGTIDCTYPEFTTCPSNKTVNTAVGSCSAVVNYTVAATSIPAPDISYVFSGATVGAFTGTGSGSTFNTGVTTVALTANNSCGNTSCTFTVTVNDGQNPSITCPTSVTRSTDPSQCTAVVTYANPLFSDNCSGANITRTSGLASGSAFPKGVNMVEWKATDASGNMSICQFTVTVNDTQLPSIACPANIVKNADAGLCTAVVTFANATASDNCAGVTVLQTAGPASGTAFSKTVTTIEFKATDSASPANTKTCSFTVTVNDNQPPTITCPSNQVKNTDAGLCSAVVNYAIPTATDNCTGVSVAIQSGLPTGSAFPKGQTTVIWKATDGANLTKTCSFRVTVNDTEAPTMTCPAAISKNTDAGLCTAIVTYTNPTFTDNCPPTAGTSTRYSGLTSGSAFPVGTSNVVFQAADASGNTRRCTMVVTVTDNQLPVITCPANIAATGSGSPCQATVTHANPTMTDNCGGATQFLLSGLASGSVFPVGATINTWRALASNGQSSTCSFTVTVSCSSASQQTGMNRDQEMESNVSSTPAMTLTLAPNPTDGRFNLELQGFAKQALVTIFDATGRQVWQQRVGSETLTSALTSVTVDLSDTRFSAGLYLVTVASDGTVLTKRLALTH